MSIYDRFLQWEDHQGCILQGCLADAPLSSISRTHILSCEALQHHMHMETLPQSMHQQGRIVLVQRTSHWPTREF